MTDSEYLFQAETHQLQARKTRMETSCPIDVIYITFVTAQTICVYLRPSVVNIVHGL